MRPLEGKLKVLAGTVAFFLVSLFYCAHLFPNNERLFQAVETLLSGFAAILMAELRKELGQELVQPPPGGGTENMQTTVTSKTGPAVPVTPPTPPAEVKP